MPYEVTVTGQFTVPRTCRTCGQLWPVSFSVTQTSGVVWRSGVRRMADSMRSSVQGTAAVGAPNQGHVCPFCLHLSVEAFATVFRDGLYPGLLQIYDASLEVPAGVLSMVGCVFGGLMLIPLPVGGIPLLLVSVPFQIRARRQVKECREARQSVETRLKRLQFSVKTLERIAVRCALAKSKYACGDFEPRLAWCQTLRRELDAVDNDPANRLGFLELLE